MIMVNNPGSWSYIYSPLRHASWHGCTPTDLVFPFFLFAVGNALSFVMPKMETIPAGEAVTKIIKRGLLIFGIGLLLNWFPFVQWNDNQLIAKPISHLRIFGVLQRIGIAYTLGALAVYFFKSRGAAFFAMTTLLAYWLITRFCGQPGIDPYSLEGFWGTHLDRAVLGDGHIYHGEGVGFDPEGIASTLPAIAQVIFGYLAGQYIQLKGKNESMVANLFVSGLILWLGGMAWGLEFPINKKIWSSSYVLYTCGLATMILAAMIQLIEFRHWKGRWSHFFDVFGKNPLFIYVMSALIPKSLALVRIPNGVTQQGKSKFTSPLGWFYEHVCAPLSDKPENGSFLYAVIFITVLWMMAWYMDKRKIYVRV